MFFGCKRCRVIEYQYNLPIFGFGFMVLFFVLWKATITLFWVSILVPQTPIGLPQEFLTTWNVWRIFLNQRSMAVNIGSSFFWKEALIASCFGWYFSYIWKSKTLLHLQALIVSDGILLNLFLKGWRVTRSFPMSSPEASLFCWDPAVVLEAGFTPKKIVGNWWNWCFLKASKMIRIPRLLLARRFKWGHQWSTSGPPVECRLLGDTHHDERDPCVAVVLSLRIWRELAKPFSLQYKRTRTLGFGTGWMLSLLRDILSFQNMSIGHCSPLHSQALWCVFKESSDGFAWGKSFQFQSWVFVRVPPCRQPTKCWQIAKKGPGA